MKSKSLTNTYLSMLCTELAMLLDAGLTINDSIHVMLEDEHGKDGKALLQGLIGALEKDNAFSGALDSLGVFPHYMVQMVRIGEKTGRLVETLNALSDYYDKQEQLSKTIKSSVLYPAILLLLMIAVVLVLIVQVLPIFNDVFSRLGTQMSPLATTLMRFGIWLGDFSVVIAAVLAVVFVLAFLMWAIPGLRSSLSQAFKDKWGGSGVIGSIASSRFTAAMSLAMASGLDIEDAVLTATGVSGGTKAMEKKHDRCAMWLQAGSSLAEAMLKSEILTPQESKLLAVGSRSGRADAAMAEIARRSNRNAQDRLDRIVGRIEPLLVIISSVVVGVILLSVMLPLMGIMTSIG